MMSQNHRYKVGKHPVLSSVTMCSKIQGRYLDKTTAVMVARLVNKKSQQKCIPVDVAIEPVWRIVRTLGGVRIVSPHFGRACGIFPVCVLR